MLFVEDLNSLPPIHIAAYNGDTHLLQAVVGAGEQVDLRANTAGDNGSFFHSLTPLMVAAGSEYSTVEMVRLLLDMGADPQSKSAGNVTAFWYAASSGDISRLRLLLETGGNPDETADNGRSAICEAARVGDYSSMQLLLAAGASPHPFSDENAYTSASSYQIPLFLAAQSGNSACVDVLLKANVLADVTDKNDSNALICAGSAEVVTTMIQAGCPVNTFNRFGFTALDEALANERVDVVRALVAAGTRLEERNTNGYTALAHFCQSIEVSATMVQLLIDLGADIHARIYQGRTALHQAAELWSGDRQGVLGDVVKVLVNAGIPVDVRTDDGCTPLHLSVGEEGTAISAVEALLDLGADINATNDAGQTPLMIAVAWGFYGEEVVPLLLARGAKLRQVTADGRTARDYAEQRIQVWEQIVAKDQQKADLDEIALHQQILEKTRKVLEIIDTALKDNAQV